MGGPHGGHLLELGDEEYHLEWVHDDATGLLTVYILDGAMENEVPIAAPSLTIERTIGESAASFELLPVGAAGEPTAQFAITDKSLIEALKLAGEGVTVRTEVDIDGRTYEAEFAHEEH